MLANSLTKYTSLDRKSLLTKRISVLSKLETQEMETLTLLPQSIRVVIVLINSLLLLWNNILLASLYHTLPKTKLLKELRLNLLNSIKNSWTGFLPTRKGLRILLKDKDLWSNEKKIREENLLFLKNQGRLPKIRSLFILQRD